MTRFTRNRGWRWVTRWWAGRRTEFSRPVQVRLRIEGLETRDLLSFHFAGSFPAGTSPTQVAVADVTGDGKADVLVSNQDGVALLRGNGDGTFRSPQMILTGATTAVTVADLNHDGKPDLIAADASGLRVLLGNGDGTFRPGQSIPALVPAPGAVVTNTVTVADLNHDGKPDLILTSDSYSIGGPYGRAAVLLGNGDGTFRAPQPIPTDGFAGVVGVADLNGDGKLDLVTTEILCGGINCHGQTDEVKVHLGNGDGTFQPGTVVASVSNYLGGGQQITGGLLGDLRGNGKPDLILTIHSTPTAGSPEPAPDATEVLLGNGNGTFQAPRPFNLNLGTFQPSALADLNGDGKLDLVLTSGHYLAVALGNGDGTFQPYTPLVYFGGTGGVAVADVNGDGKPDLISADPAGGSVRVFLNGPNPSPPLFAVGGGNGHVQIHRGGDNALVADFAPYGAGYTGPVNIAWGDVTGDGFRDLVTAAGAGNPQVKVFDGKAIAQGTFSPANPDASLLTSFFAYGLNFNIGATIAVGDIEHNGFADIVTGATAGNPQVKVYRGQAIAQGTFNRYNPDASLLTSFFAYGLSFNIGVNVAVGDLNGDGFADLVTGPTAGNPEVKVFDGKSLRSLNQLVNPTGGNLLAAWYAYGLNFNVGASVVIGDVEGTGTPNIITGATSGNPHVEVYQLTQSINGTPMYINYGNADTYKVAQFLAFDASQNIGVTVSAQDYESMGLTDILAGASSGPAKYRVFRAPAALGQPQVQVAEGALSGFPPGVTIGG